MAGLNHVTLIGRLVKDAECKKIPSGSSVSSFTIAVDGTPKSNGERTTDFIPCTCWNKTAENVAKYTSKGSLVAVDGRISQRSYEDKTGAKRSLIEVVASNVVFLEKKAQNQEQPYPVDSSNTQNYSYFDSGSSEDEPFSSEGIDAKDDELPF